MAAQMPGGFSQPCPADEEAQQIADEVKAQVKEKTGHCYVEYRAVLYRSQVVAGTNTLIKVHVGLLDYIHLLVFRALLCDGGKVVLRDLLTMAAQMPGGFSHPCPADEETQQITEEVKAQVEERTGKCYVEYRAVLFRSQVVAGTNTLIKVHVGGLEYIHLLAFKALPCYGGHVVLSGVQQHKTKDDPLVPFTS